MGSSSRSGKPDPPAGGASLATADLITIGRVAAPHGLRGELRVVLETDFPQRFAGLRTAYLVHRGRVQAVTIAGYRPHRGGLLLTIEGVGDPEAARRLRGAAVAVPREAVVPLGADEYYVFELMGLTARTSSGRVLGVVTEILRGPAHDIYVVEGEGRTVLIPAVRQVVRRVDRAAGEITVELPEGLEEPRRAH